MWLSHAGHRVDADDAPTRRFPSDHIADVRRRIRAVLTSLAPGGVVSAPAAGADLIVLTEAIRLGIPIHVVLPLSESEFLDRSVADRGPGWVDEFRTVTTHALRHSACSLQTIDLSSDPDWYLAGNTRILDRTHELTGEPIVALAIMAAGNGSDSATHHFVDEALARELVVLVLDPMDDGPIRIAGPTGPPDIA